MAICLDSDPFSVMKLPLSLICLGMWIKRPGRGGQCLAFLKGKWSKNLTWPFGASVKGLSDRVFSSAVFLVTLGSFRILNTFQSYTLLSCTTRAPLHCVQFPALMGDTHTILIDSIWINFHSLGSNRFAFIMCCVVCLFVQSCNIYFFNLIMKLVFQVLFSRLFILNKIIDIPLRVQS